MSSEYIKNISLNPFFCSKLIHHFAAGYEEEIDLPLVYLILPYVLYEPSRSVLKAANINTSLYTLFIDKDKSSNIAGIEKRYSRFKELTNKSLIVAYNESLIKINGKVKIVEKADYRKIKDKNLKEYYRAAYYLGKIFSKYKTVDIFIKIGVKAI